MKCSWKYDVSDLIHRKMNYVFLGMIPLLIALLNQVYHQIGPEQVELLMGMRCASDFPLDVLIYLWNVCFFLYLAVQLFTNQFHASYEYFFCRLTKPKWVVYKLSFLFFVTLGYKLVLFLFLWFFSSESLEELLLLLGCNLLFTFCLQLVVLVFYAAWTNKKYLIPILLLGLGLLWNGFWGATFPSIEDALFYQFGLLFPFFFLGSLFFLKNELTYLFEGSQ